MRPWYPHLPLKCFLAKNHHKQCSKHKQPPHRDQQCEPVSDKHRLLWLNRSGHIQTTTLFNVMEVCYWLIPFPAAAWKHQSKSCTVQWCWKYSSCVPFTRKKNGCSMFFPHLKQFKKCCVSSFSFIIYSHLQSIGATSLIHLMLCTKDIVQQK